MLFRSDDTRIQLDNDTSVYIDAGKPGQSIIMQEAIDMISKAASRIESISMLLPDGPLGKALRIATDREKDPVHAEVVTSSVGPKQALGWGSENVFELLKTFNRLKHSLSRSNIQIIDMPRGVHSKVLIADGDTDEAYAYVGTHNLNESGVKAGTQEWGIFTRDRELVQNLRKQYLDFKSEAGNS